MSVNAANETDETPPPPVTIDLAPPDFYDPVIEAYKKDVDQTLLRENLKLTVEERFRKFESFMEYVHELRAAGRVKDLEVIAELQALLEERRRQEPSP